ncbi:MAG: efflux RND transporter periplasmic adaptor subunit [Anaerolineales bacterium]|jgi:HlyD family secretion protein
MKPRRRILWVIVVLVSLLSACGSGSRAQVIQASGFLEARVYRVVSLVEGRVTSVEVAAGDEITQGQELVNLDLAGLESQRQAAAAALAQAEADLDRLERAPTQADVERLTADLKAAQVDLLTAETALNQLEDAYGGGEPPDRLSVPAQTAVDSAQAGVDLAQARLDQAQAGARTEELRAAQAAVQEAQAHLNMAELQLEYASGVSPVDGVVQQVGLRAGEEAAPGTLIATVADTRQLFVIIYLDQDQVARLEIGDDAEVSVDAYPGDVFQGQVSWIAEEAQFTPSTVQTEEERISLVFAVRIEIDNTEGRLIAGLPSDVTISP